MLMAQLNSNCYGVLMDEIRRKNLERLIEQYEVQDALADAVGVTPGYISQLRNGTRPLNEKTTEKYEKKLGLPPKWFDVDHDKGFSEQERQATLKAEDDINEIKQTQAGYSARGPVQEKFDALSDKDKQTILSLLDSLLANK